MKQQLAEVLAPVLGEVSIENLTTLTGGASRTTWAFDAVGEDSRQALILRTGPPDDVHAGMELEASVQQRAAAAGAPVPHILAADNSPVALGNPYLICNVIGGETIVRRIHRSLDDAGRDRLLEQCAQALAAIHRADPDGIGLEQTEQLTEWRNRLDEMGDTTATFEWAFRWLAANRPPPTPPRLVHGDFRMGNLIVDGSGLAAVLDWELVHIGEVYEDLAWFCITGLAVRGAGGSRRRRARQCRELSLRLRGGRGHRRRPRCVPLAPDGRDAELGRHLPLPGRAPPFGADAVGRTCRHRPPRQRNRVGCLGSARGRWPAMSSLYGRPTAAELVAAVADFLDSDVREATEGQVSFHARVAANVLRTVERELTDDRATPDMLGYDDEEHLAAAIRAGDLDGRAADVLPCLRTLVRHRLAVAHPGYDETT